MKKTLALLIAIFCVTGGAYFILVNINHKTDNFEVVRNNVEVSFDSLNTNIFMSARAWGISGNHEEIILSNQIIGKEHQSYSKSECYIFYTSDIFYKKIGENSLIVYAAQSSISEPEDFVSPIEITVIPLKNSREINDYLNNYEKYGLSKISSH